MRQRLFLLLVLAACGGDDDGNPAIPDACNPLGGQGCMLPWPSMAYVTADAATATGFRLDLPREAMPVNRDGIPLEPALFNRWDGFSAIGPMLAIFPAGVSADGLPPHTDPDASLAPASPIVLLDLETGARAPFFAEVDQTVQARNRTKAALIIRPLARLRPGGHYAVAIRNTVKDAGGNPLEPSPGFEALRDGKDLAHPRFAAVKANAAMMFDALAAAGVDKRELVLAWDFVTVSDELVRSDLRTMREAALPAIGTDGANVTFTTVTQPNTPRTFRRYTGTFTSPSFLTDGEADASVMRRDEQGLPVRSGTYDARFAAIVPACMANLTPQELPRPVVVFGHGLFGSAEGYLNDSFVEGIAEEQCFTIVAGDFIGLTERQLATAPLAVNDFNKAPQIADKLAQAIIDFIALESAVRGPMALSDAFKVGTRSVIDPTRVYYVGGSLGGIMGNTFMAYDPNITRGVLAVPGGNWSLLLERSTAWSLLLGIHQGAYPDPEVHQLNLALALGMGMEPVDPMTTAAHVLKDPLFGSPAKNILIWYALGDSLVTNITTEMIAREMGIPLLGPSVKTPWNMTAMTGPSPNGIVIYDEKREPLPYTTNQPQEDNGTHSGVNRRPAVMRQLQKFLLSPFEASQQCLLGASSAPCDCSTGACD
jgi:pimeloyl-ACP methyl ester carboxylesterase